MSPPAAPSASSNGLVVEDGVRPSREFYRFLRYSHVLGSLLRELLEERYLREVCPHPLTRAQFCFLKLVTLNSDLQIGEVARCLGVSPAAGSKTIDKLESLGLVRRETSTTDRRVTMLKVRTRGRQLVRDYERLKASSLSPVVDSLGEERSRVLCDLLEEVCVGLLEHEELSQESCLRCAGYYRSDCSLARIQGTCALRAHDGAPDEPARGMA